MRHELKKSLTEISILISLDPPQSASIKIIIIRSYLYDRYFDNTPLIYINTISLAFYSHNSVMAQYKQHYHFLGSLSVLILDVIIIIVLLVVKHHEQQFKDWYPFYHTSLTNGTEIASCYTTYNKNVKLYGSYDSTTCKNMTNCLMNNNGEINKQDWASALILLGLTPTIIGALGPKINERAKLMNQNFILGTLCTIGSPSLTFSWN